RHNDPAVVEAMETWYAHVLRYSRRDQLSLWVALRQAGLAPLVHKLDNFESPYHRWPVTAYRNGHRVWETWMNSEHRLEMQDALVVKARQIETLEHRLKALQSTRSWRWTAPWRALVEMFR